MRFRIGKKKQPLKIGELSADEREHLNNEFLELCAEALNQNFAKKAISALDQLKHQELDGYCRITVAFPVEITAGVLIHLLDNYRERKPQERP